MMRSDAHSGNLRLHRVNDRPANFFVTKSLRLKKPVLDKPTRQLITSAFQFAVQQNRIYLRAFVAMPGHWHALFALNEGWTLAKFMHSIMSFVAARTACLLQANGTSWQDSYYETLIKTDRQFQYVANYIEQNPVAKNLVDRADKWDASSVTKPELVTSPWPWSYDY